MIIEILRHTPVWVWLMLAALLALGGSQARTRELAPSRLLILPLAMLALGLWSLASLLAAQPWALLGWAASFAAMLIVAQRSRVRAGVRWSAGTGRLHLPGSWVPMVIIVAIFLLKYGVGVSVALQPSLRADGGFALCIACLYGALNGLLLGRALALWRLTRGLPARLATTM